MLNNSNNSRKSNCKLIENDVLKILDLYYNKRKTTKNIFYYMKKILIIILYITSFIEQDGDIFHLKFLIIL